MELVPKPKSKFIEVVCPKCKNEQIIFNKAATKVFCVVCGNLLAEPTGGMADVKSKIIKIHG
jgi:small subunit ribosomal protein S27e